MEHRDSTATHVEVAIDDARRLGESAQQRVVSEQILERSGLRRIVDRDDVDVRIVVDGAEEIPPESSKTHDRDAYRHVTFTP